ncbi:hypothetical protein [Flectobacillus roseus]|uniref:DUF4397 domain-containing protein n=1 Tax=Flectobacillus roseus TaxID=502259 RepID=A0ABT6Y789_9BACT|nr:hypothetical protein [Flectobacillus roseus]MDI9858988.1 hypothetical protein [Flectobacillus roseus]
MFFTFATQAQVKIGTNPSVITPSAILDVESTNKGVIFPRVALSSSTDQTTITTPATGLMVFCTGTAGLSSGYYFWNGTNWVNFVTSSSGSGSSGGSGVAQYFNFKIVTGVFTPATPHTVTANDHVIFLRYDGTSTGSTSGISSTPPFLNPNATLVLPDPTTCAGRVLRLVNDSHRVFVGGQSVYTNYPMYTYDSSTLYTTAPPSLSYTLQASLNGSQWVIMSDGSRWISINVVIV